MPQRLDESPHLLYIWGLKCKCLWATRIILLFSKLPGSVIPHDLRTIKGSRKFAGSMGGNFSFSLILPQLFQELLVSLSAQKAQCSQSKVTPRVKFGWARRVLGRDLRSWEGGGREMSSEGIVMLTSCSRGLERLPMTWPSPPPVASACPDASCHVAVRITHLMEWNSGTNLGYPQNSHQVSICYQSMLNP